MKRIFILLSLLLQWPEGLLWESPFGLVPFSLFAQGWHVQNPAPLYSVCFADANAGWVVGDFGTIHHTTDGGTFWTIQASGTSNNLGSVFFTDANIGWAVGDAGTIVHTTDGGTRWMDQTSGTSTNLGSVFFADPNTGWVAGDAGTIVHTTDGGTTWTVQTSGTSNDLGSIFFTDANIGWAVGDVGTIVHTTDGGTRWMDQTSGTSTNLGSVFFADPNTGWAAGDAGTIVHTTDGGTTWTVQISGTSTNLGSVFFADANIGWAVGDAGTIVHTTDGGTTWMAQTSGTVRTFYSVFFADANTGWVVGASGTILHTVNGGTTWSIQTSPRLNHFPSVFFIDANTGWVVGDPGIILHTTNGGTTWTDQISGVMAHFYSVFFTDANTGWAVAGQGTIVHTTDGGATWTVQTSGGSYILWSIVFTDANTGWTVGGDGTILHTIDGGSSWTAQTSGTPYNLYSVFFIDPSTGLTVGQEGTILHTTDGGTTWMPQSSGTTRTLFSICFIDPNTGWSVGTNGTIRHTTDGGTTWTAQVSGTTNALRSVFFTDSNTGWAAGDRGTIVHTTNGGTTWTAQSNGATNTLDCIFFIDANTGWTVGEEGNILHTTTGGTGNEPPLSPTLSSPLNGSAVSTSPLLSWDQAPEALWYTLQVSTSPYFVTYQLNRTNITETSYQLSGLQADTTYYWRVSLTDGMGTSGWTETWSFTVHDVPNQVSLVAPPDGEAIASDSAVFVWNQNLSLVDRYWIEADEDSSLATPFVDSLLTDTTRTLHDLANNETYYWRVRAHNSVGWGPFSDVWRFSVLPEVPASPMLVSPPDSAFGISTSPMFSWNPSLGADFYTLQLSDTSGFSSFVVNEDSLTETSLEVTGLSNTTTYYWRVSARNAGGTSPWSEAWSFTTLLPLPAQVTLVSPVGGATILEDSVRVLWRQAAPEIDRYWFDYATDSSFMTATTDSSLSHTSAVVRNLRHHETYYWRVRAHNASGWGPFSTVRNFLILTTPPLAPLLVSPPDGATNQPLTMTFSWRTVSPALMSQMIGEGREVALDRDEVQMKKKSCPRNSEVISTKGVRLMMESLSTSTDTVWYHLQVASDAGFDSLLVNDSTLVDTTGEVSSLRENRTYYWRVRARNLFGTSLWSDVWSFTTLPVPVQVVLASPENGAILAELSAVCHWFPSTPEIDRYWFEWASDSLFTDARIDSTGDDTMSIASPLLNNQTYYWKVRAHNEAGWGEFSDVWSFSVSITGAEEDEQIPTVFNLSQNYPNPFNPSTTISYGLPEQAHVRLEVFNVLGQRVAVVADEEQEAGFHSALFDGSGLASGVYVYRLSAGTFVQTKRVLLLR